MVAYVNLRPYPFAVFSSLGKATGFYKTVPGMHNKPRRGVKRQGWRASRRPAILPSTTSTRSSLTINQQTQTGAHHRPPPPKKKLTEKEMLYHPAI